MATLDGPIASVAGAGTRPEEPAAQQLAREWLALLQRFAGDDPATHQKIRQANEQEPALKDSTWMNDRMKDYLARPSRT